MCSRCLDNIFIGKPCQCSVNANVWEGVKVGLPEEKPAEAQKHVVVVGAGPGGLEAARVVAVRGHKVTVLDKSDRVAGLLGMAQVLNAKIEPLVSYWNEEMKLHPNIEVAQHLRGCRHGEGSQPRRGHRISRRRHHQP